MNPSKTAAARSWARWHAAGAVETYDDAIIRAVREKSAVVNGVISNQLHYTFAVKPAGNPGAWVEERIPQNLDLMNRLGITDGSPVVLREVGFHVPIEVTTPTGEVLYARPAADVRAMYAANGGRL